MLQLFDWGYVDDIEIKYETSRKNGNADIK